MDAAPPTPTPPAGTPRPRASQAALASCVLCLCLFAGYRLSAPSRAARPTEEAPPRRQIDLNRADRSELLQVPGLGPSSADAILAHRAERGPFGSIDELTHVHGIGPKTTEKVKPWLNVGDEPIEKLERKPAPSLSATPGKGTKIQTTEAKIDVNAAGEAELMRLPGIGPALAGRIVQYRANAPFASIDDLRKVKGIGAKTLDAIRPFIFVAKK
jgi:competence protein ComEA